MPAPAEIPARGAYFMNVAVKKLVVEITCGLAGVFAVLWTADPGKNEPTSGWLY